MRDEFLLPKFINKDHFLNLLNKLTLEKSLLSLHQNVFSYVGAIYHTCAGAWYRLGARAGAPRGID